MQVFDKKLPRRLLFIGPLSVVTSRNNMS